MHQRPKNGIDFKMPGIELQLSLRRAVFNAYPVRDGRSSGLTGIIAIAFSPMRELKEKFTAVLLVCTDITVERIFADGEIELHLESPTDNLR
ncbi:hypothetical protein D3C73_1506410 [compost metagenome]